MAGDIELGIVNSWDPETMTAEISRFDGSSHIANATVIMQSCDIGNGAYSFTPPSIGAPCLFTKVSGEHVILGHYAPPNLSANTDVESTTGSTLNRSLDEMPTDGRLPGDTIATSPSGFQVGLRNLLYAIEASPIFYSMWNLANSVWDNMCNKFRFSSPGADINVDVDGGSATNVNISVRRNAGERGGVPAVNLDIGHSAGVINLKINGQDFCHVDIDRNVTLNVRNLRIVGDCVNMEGVQSVLLP